MKYWEYKVIDWKNCHDAIDHEYDLNKLGEEGWELVLVTPDPTTNEGYPRYYFKRVKEPRE